MDFKIVKYNEEYYDIWNDFVMNQSANGTIFHTQKFLSYHPKDRFKDESILIYKGSKLICVFPCAKTEDGYFSHPGTSAGGPVIHNKHFKMKILTSLISFINNYYDNRLTIKLSESYYVNNYNEALLYLYLKNSKIYPEISTYKSLNYTEVFSSVSQQSTRSAVRKLYREGYYLNKTTLSDDYSLFHYLLTENLKKYNTKPVHDLDELIRLKDILAERQNLFFLKNKDNEVCSCCWVIIATKDVWHTQYIVKDYEKNKNGLVELMLVLIADEAKKYDAKILSLGISTEDKGRFLNEGLISFKEHLGINYLNRYVIEINNEMR